ncbi:16S rRNA (cytosine(1402)-N(4))-methyltransferase RsmH [Patescibacteria group bacterium]|nr:16S rRNA (cytosine(1402)-N(4))-methyltransferase RsmH [Patescibacteria group bacterium]
MKHISVLPQEAVDALALTKDAIVVDATLGAGGHARLILSELGHKGTYIGFDADSTAIEALQDLKKAKATVHLVHSNFVNIQSELQKLHIESVDAILADLGWRTDQFTDGGKGFSFTSDDSLFMTYGDPSQYAFTAGDIVNGWDADDIANVLFGYGEERYSRQIAKAIVEYRKKNTIKTAAELAEIIFTSVPMSYRHGRIHPATKSFQGLRIAVNDEFKVLEDFLAHAWQCLSPNGRLAIISFHSLEDRIVKHTFRNLVQAQSGVLITKRPIVASSEELKANPRARSAKLRIIQKI